MRIFWITLLSVLALAVPADADHCETYTTSAPEVALAGYYVDTEFCQPECFSWQSVYEESNGIDGLQRSDESIDDTCHGMIAPDTLIVGFWTPG